MVDKQTDIFLILRKESGLDSHVVAYNTKLLAAIDYCNEASIKMSMLLHRL